MTTEPVPLRAAVRAMPAYVPGARAAAGDRPMVKLSSNENPFPPHPAVVEAIRGVADQVNRYPDMYAGELVAAIAQRHGWQENGVVAGNGSVAVLAHVLEAVCAPGDEVVYAWRSFEAYPIAVAVAGASAAPVALTPEGRHDLPAMAEAVTARTRAVLLCSPNNPTGPVLRQDDLEDLLASIRSDVLVVLDEAYAEFVREPAAADGASLLEAWPNLVVLRTFSKAFALAGLRVGYALAQPELATGFRSVSTPFGVNAVAQAAAIAALGVQAQAMELISSLVEERERVLTALADHGWNVPEAQGNFLWLPLGSASTRFAAHARDLGVLVRPFTDDGVRVSIGAPEENDAFLEVVREWAVRNV
jgi:histidinol-phosphate aminotransferase